MNIPEELFQLIKSLDKNEKRYFRLQAGFQEGEKSYLKLFDALDSMKEYEEEVLQKKLKGQKFLKQLPVVRHYLRDMIMHSLRNFNTGASVELKLKDMLKDVEVLFRKRLYGQCEKAIEKGKAMAAKYERFIDLQYFLRWEFKLMKGTQYQYKKEEGIFEFIRASETAIDHYKNQLASDLLASRILLKTFQQGLVRSDEDRRFFDNLISAPLLSAEENAFSFHAKMNYYMSHGTYNLVKRDMEGTYLGGKGLVELMERYPHQAEDDSSAHVTALNNLVVALIGLRRYDEVPGYIEKMKRIKTSSERSRNDIYFLAINHEIHMNYVTGDFGDGLKQVPSILEKLDAQKPNASNKRYETHTRYNLACMLIAAGDHSAAAKQLRRIINAGDADPRSEMHAAARILQLIVHAELGKRDLLPYIVRSTYRYFFKRNRLYKFENIVMAFIRNKVPKIRRDNELVEAYRNLKEELDPLLQDEFEAKAFEYFDYISWMESKIEGKSFAEIIRGKLKGEKGN